MAAAVYISPYCCSISGVPYCVVMLSVFVTQTGCQILSPSRPFQRSTSDATFPSVCVSPLWMISAPARWVSCAAFVCSKRASISAFAVAIAGSGVSSGAALGAAIATVASQVVSAVLCIIKLTRSDGPYRLEIKRIGFDLPLLKKITSQGVPSGVQNSIIAIANVVVQSSINLYGPMAMAGCGSYSKIEGFGFLPINSFALALATFIGQNLGAKQYDRARRGARFGILCSIVIAELIGVALFFLAPYAMRLFNDDPAVVAIGVRQSHIEALFFCFLAFAHGVSAVLRGAGRAQVPMYTMLGCWCILRVSYITLALKVWPDIATIFWAYPITWSVSCVVFLIYYLKADWVHALEKSL